MSILFLVCFKRLLREVLTCIEQAECSLRYASLSAGSGYSRALSRVCG